MKYQWFEEYATSKKGAYKEYKPEWEVARYMVRDKMFIMHGGDKEGKEIITLKLEPAFGEFLRGQYNGDIVPGYYMNKDHWNSVYVDGNVPDDALRDMVDKSYALILGAFSQKAQKEILETGMKNITVRIINDNKKDFLDLLLLADEQEDMIDKYLDRGILFALYDGELKSVCVVTDEGGGTLEIQNLATYERFQRQGYASKLIDYIVEHYRSRYDRIILGTGDVPGTLGFYGRHGFIVTHRLPDYFTLNYDHPIMEDGVLLKDKVYLERTL